MKMTQENNFLITFGLEIHAVLDTKMKAFSTSLHDLSSPPNHNVSMIDLGFPGLKPIVNNKMIEYAYRVAKSLDMQINRTIFFDRKNYFYPDLPKGYQITQYFQPIGTKGKLIITLDDNTTKVIRIRDIHMEEDTAKQIMKTDGIYFDFNRAGIPLIEIVSEHNDFDNISEVLAFLRQLRYQLMLLGVNNGRLSDGSFRVDVNISVREKNQKQLNNKVEIKNLNSFSNVKTSLEYEINNQINLLKQGKKIKSVTKRFNEKTQTTDFLREKIIEKEYNYFHEGNINPIKLTDKLIDYFDKFEIIKINEAIKRLSKYNLSIIDKKFFLESKEFYNFFFELLEIFKIKNIISYFNKIFIPEFKKNHFLGQNYQIPKKIIIKIIDLLLKNKITNDQALRLTKDLLNNKDIYSELEHHDKKILLSEEEIIKLINKILNNHPKLMDEKDTRPQRISKFLMGQLMKETKGQINAKIANKLINNIINLDEKK